MTDSTMVERVALIFAQHGDHFFDNDGPSSASWDDFSPREQLVATAAARAAIEAMKPVKRKHVAGETYPSEIVAESRRRALAGEKLVDISADLGIPKSTVQRICNDIKKPIDHRGRH